MISGTVRTSVFVSAKPKIKSNRMICITNTKTINHFIDLINLVENKANKIANRNDRKELIKKAKKQNGANAKQAAEKYKEIPKPMIALLTV